MLYDVGVFVIAILIRSVMLKRLTLYSLEEVSLLYPFQGVKRGGGGVSLFSPFQGGKGGGGGFSGLWDMENTSIKYFSGFFADTVM